MAFWGIAYAAGPNYNKAWRFFDKEDFKSTVIRANAALARASVLASRATPIEKSLIKALTARFPPAEAIHEDFDTLNRAYADAMRPAYLAHADDMDMASFFADALMCITPRGLWDLDTGKVSGSHTTEAQEVIESAFRKPEGMNHLALCHLQIHLLEMSPSPETALPAADRLRNMVPDASHMLHMPTHIDAAVGDYRRSVDTNHNAMVADDKYFSRESASTLYTGYRVHYICAKLYAALMSGRYQDAMSAAEKLEEVIDMGVLSMTSPPMADWVESFLGNKAHVLIRFGRWDEILRLELPSDRKLLCATTATILYARGLAFSALGRITEAEEAQSHFEEARATVPASRLNSVPCREIDVLSVASAMLSGELEYRKGNFGAAFSALRDAAKREDSLAYSDPPPWMQPVRHALGGLLLEQNRVNEAEQVFREDLGLAVGFPRRRARINNIWGLHGLHECLTRSGKSEEDLYVRASLDLAIASADVPVAASCFCRTTAFENAKCCDKAC